MAIPGCAGCGTLYTIHPVPTTPCVWAPAMVYWVLWSQHSGTMALRGSFKRPSSSPEVLTLRLVLFVSLTAARSETLDDSPSSNHPSGFVSHAERAYPKSSTRPCTHPSILRSFVFTVKSFFRTSSDHRPTVTTPPYAIMIFDMLAVPSSSYPRPPPKPKRSSHALYLPPARWAWVPAIIM